MIRRSPCELYIKYLLVHPDEYSDENIRDIVRGQQLDYIGHDYLVRLRRRMRQPIPFYPNDRMHAPSRRLIDKHKLAGFFHPDETSIAAMKLLEKPRAKELIETMVIAEDPPALIAHRLRGIGLTTTVRAIKRYCSFYWNISLVDSTELRALLQMRVEYPRYRDDGMELIPETKLQLSAMKKAQYQDPRRMMVDIPIVPMAGLMNRLRMGMMPSQLDLAKLANVTRIAATVRSFQSTMSGGPNGAVQAMNYAIVAEKMSAMIEDLGSPDMELQRDLQQLGLATDDGTVPYIGELEGAHTVSLEPIEAEATEVK